MIKKILSFVVDYGTCRQSYMRKLYKVKFKVTKNVLDVMRPIGSSRMHVTDRLEHLVLFNAGS